MLGRMFVLQRMLAEDHRSKLKSLYFVSSLFWNFTVLLPLSINFPLVTPHHCIIITTNNPNPNPYWTLPAAAAFAIWTLSDCVYPHWPPSLPYTQCYYISPAILELSLSHIFQLHMTSPKLYPVFSALSLVLFEYDEVHKLGFQVSFCWSMVSSLYYLQMHLKTQASKLMHHRTPLVMALTLPSLVKPMEILAHNISFTLEVKV